ncbi:MAG TPA: anaerobic C4-dicarboxylate transporter family protein, partial [Acidimicrobiia bacterium]|nr:anaerobic C4-dicarboxylate transporter family protein [Acidimicrobiia bacterium]
MDITFILEAVVVLAAIVMGTRAGGVGIGVWGGLGVAVLVFVFGEAPGEPPISALLIILAVVTAAALMQVAGGVDWMVKIAAAVIQRHPKQITLIAPLTAFLFTVGAGTSNILYPLLPVIYDVSYQNGIRPSRPLTVTVVQSGMSLAASPVSAAMAAMVTLTAVEPYNFDLAQILSITFPAGVIGIIVTALIVGRMGKDIDEDPEIQERIASGALGQPGSAGQTVELTSTKEGRNAGIIFLLGVLAIVILGLFPDLRPAFEVEGEAVTIDMTTTIELVMFTVGVLIIMVSKPDVSEVPGASVFKAGMVSAIALFGIAWLTATFIAAHEEFIVTTIGGWVNQAVWIFAIAVFLVAALTTSQSTATRTIVPIGLAAGLAPGLVTG